MLPPFRLQYLLQVLLKRMRSQEAICHQAGVRLILVNGPINPQEHSEVNCCVPTDHENRLCEHHLLDDPQAFPPTKTEDAVENSTMSVTHLHTLNSSVSHADKIFIMRPSIHRFPLHSLSLISSSISWRHLKSRLDASGEIIWIHHALRRPACQSKTWRALL
jgi:hypothetical protein